MNAQDRRDRERGGARREGTASGGASCDIAIVGGGLVGAALAFGLRHRGARVLVLDEGDVAHRAARGNFGLVWVQGKGVAMPDYARWTLASARAWPRLAAEVHAATGIDVALRQSGGVHVCFSEAALAARAERLRALTHERHGAARVEVLDRAALKARVPDLGPEAVGGTWCADDGECNPLLLLRALTVSAQAAGVRFVRGTGVTRIEPVVRGFLLHAGATRIVCDKVVLAAGLGNAMLAPLVGLAAPVTPNRGQILALERVPPFLSVAFESLRQTADGTVLVGDAQEESGFDESQRLGVMAAMAARAVRTFPHLRDARVVRAWSALRVMSPDGFPIYAQSRTHPGAFVVTCHSGVTLAAAHAFELAAAIGEGGLPPACSAFAPERFDVRAAA